MEDNPSTSSGQDSKPIAIIAVALVALIGGGLWWFSRSAAPTNSTPKAVNATEAPLDSSKPAAPPVTLPPLDQMDAFLRPMLQALSSRPELAKWLATDDLVRQLAMAIDRASAGDSPARDLKVLKPTGPFTTTSRGIRSTIDPASYKRYDGLVQTITSIDASKAANLYKTIRPRLNEAYQQAGNPGGNVESAVIKTIDILADTPVVKDPIAIVEHGGAWAFDDNELEALLPTQRQLLRMGPANVEKLLAWLRAFRDAI